MRNMPLPSYITYHAASRASEGYGLPDPTGCTHNNTAVTTSPGVFGLVHAQNALSSRSLPPPPLRSPSATPVADARGLISIFPNVIKLSPKVYAPHGRAGEGEGKGEGVYARVYAADIADFGVHSGKRGDRAFIARGISEKTFSARGNSRERIRRWKSTRRRAPLR